MAQSTSGGPFRCGGTMEFSASCPFPVPNPACKHAIASYETHSAALPASQRVILPHFFADLFVRRFGIPGRAHAALNPAPRGMRVQRRPGAVPVQNQAGGGGCCRRPVRRIVPPAEVVLDHHAPRAAAAGLADEPVPARQPGQGAPALSCWCLSSSRVCGRPRVVERGRGRLVRLFRIVRLAALGDRRLRVQQRYFWDAAGSSLASLNRSLRFDDPLARNSRRAGTRRKRWSMMQEKHF